MTVAELIEARTTIAWYRRRARDLKARAAKDPYGSPGWGLRMVASCLATAEADIRASMLRYTQHAAPRAR